VASTGAGRPLPLGAKIVGYGPLPQGSIVPMDRSTLSGLDTPEGIGRIFLLAVGFVSAAYGGFSLVRALR
jgi:hypothetical protein